MWIFFVQVEFLREGIEFRMVNCQAGSVWVQNGEVAITEELDARLRSHRYPE